MHIYIYTSYDVELQKFCSTLARGVVDSRRMDAVKNIYFAHIRIDDLYETYAD